VPRALGWPAASRTGFPPVGGEPDEVRRVIDADPTARLWVTNWREGDVANDSQAGRGAPSSPTIFRRLLGDQLRQLRERRRCSCEAAGRHLRGSGSKISRIESGHVKIKEDDLYALLQLYGIIGPAEQCAFFELVSLANESPWWRLYQDVVPDWFDPYLALESSAESIRTFEIRFIPGLLQTSEYAREIIGLRYPALQVDRRVALRMRRKKVLIERGATVLWAIIDEMALRQQMGEPRMMQRQIAALMADSERPDITIQILRSSDGLRAESGNSFTVFRSRPMLMPDVVYLEHLENADYLFDRDMCEPYKVHMNRIGVAAEKPDQTVMILDQIACGKSL